MTTTITWIKTLALFENVSTVEKRSTRDLIRLLRRRGVYIESITKERTIEQAFYNCVKEEKPENRDSFFPKPTGTLFESSTESVTNDYAVGYSKKLANLTKIVTDSQKYNGTSLAFDYYITIFYDFCYRAKILLQAYLRAFPCIFKGTVLSYYYTAVLLTKSTFEQATRDIRSFFESFIYSR
ncbi:hypothetical protein B0O99DRAFT_643098 [Bisporella sp. PMI_857]|nr:hypothetical protein B0O99DRAFT_643098 [Bisporella sp. PMI_857]